MFVVPKQGIVKQAFISGLNDFNAENFPGSGFNVTEQSLDDFRQLIIIDGIPDKGTARQYFSAVVNKRDLFDPLGTAEYRNFLISNENYNTFLQEKNIIEYMDFYKKVYLGN